MYMKDIDVNVLRGETYALESLFHGAVEAV